MLMKKYIGILYIVTIEFFNLYYLLLKLILSTHSADKIYTKDKFKILLLST